MLKQLLILSFMATLILAGCNSDGGNAESQGQEGSDAMAELNKDKEFGEAHETPVDAQVQGLGTMLEFDTPDGEKAKAYTIKSATPSNKYLFVIQEWWGLNDNIKQEAERLFIALGDVNVMALDMYDGKVATDQETAGKYMEEARPYRLESIVKGALAYAGDEAQIATVGWCFGGGWSLKTSIMAEEQGVACVMYYGMPVKEAAEITPLKAPVLGLFATQDKWITPNVANAFVNLATSNGKKITAHKFDADHAFANPSSPRYNAREAKRANDLALNFLKDNLNKEEEVEEVQ